MATYSKIDLSASTDGIGILVDDNATAGKLIHAGDSTATTYDEVWIYATNISAADKKLTIEYGSTTVIIEVTVTTEAGLSLVIPGLVIKGNASPVEIRAFAADTSSICLFGYVNRITA
jgi:hypothetical protein